MNTYLPMLVYSEENLFCILLMLLVGYKVWRDIDQTIEWRIFSSILIFILFFLVFDLLWGLLESGYLTADIPFIYMVNVIYLVFSGLVSYSWFIYSEYMQKSVLVTEKRHRPFTIIPLVLLVILATASIKTHWFFYIDTLGHYQQGPAYLLQMILSYGYILVTSVKAVYKAWDKKNYVNKQEYMILASFVVMPLLCGGLQILLPGVPLISLGITVAILLVYLNSQEMKISIDPLTGINNRHQMITYLSAKINRNREKKKLYLLMMDLDHFKKINDQYGHIEGDAALVRVAVALKKAAGRFPCFVSRYAGDEFIVIYETADKTQVEKLCEAIHNQLDQENEQAGTEYRLKISIGYAVYDESLRYIPDFIAAADEELYKVKKNR